jgi:hypothetical protein
MPTAIKRGSALQKSAIAVVRARSAVEQVRVVAAELRGREGAEHELLREAEQVECARSLPGIEAPSALHPWRPSDRPRARAPPQDRPVAFLRRRSPGASLPAPPSASGRMRSRTSGSAYSASQSASSIRWLSAS